MKLFISAVFLFTGFMAGVAQAVNVIREDEVAVEVVKPEYYNCYIETRNLTNDELVSRLDVKLDLADGKMHSIGVLNGEIYSAFIGEGMLFIYVESGHAIAWSGGQSEMGGISEACVRGICDPKNGVEKTMSRVGCKRDKK